METNALLRERSASADKVCIVWWKRIDRRMDGTKLAVNWGRGNIQMEKAQNSGFSRAATRIAGGARPHLLAIGFAIPLAFAACATTDGNQVTSPTVLGMDDKIPPYFDDGQTTIYEVQVPVHMPIRQPTAAESSALGKSDPYPHAPFVAVGDIRTEIRFTLTNLDDKTTNIELLVDPWNEFVRYKPGIQVVSDEQTTPDFSGWDKFIPLHAKERLQGTITADDTRELAVDLATVYNINATVTPTKDTNLNALFNHTFNPQNRSNGYDPLIAPYIPAVVPAMIGFDLGLRATADEGGAAPNIAIEVQVDVVDTSSAGNKVIRTGSTDAPMQMPTTILQPPKAPVQ
jgi:hypothetical protein